MQLPVLSWTLPMRKEVCFPSAPSSTFLLTKPRRVARDLSPRGSRCLSKIKLFFLKYSTRKWVVFLVYLVLPTIWVLFFHLELEFIPIVLFTVFLNKCRKYEEDPVHRVVKFEFVLKLYDHLKYGQHGPGKGIFCSSFRQTNVPIDF